MFKYVLTYCSQRKLNIDDIQDDEFRKLWRSKMQAQDHVIPDAITLYDGSIRIVYEWEPENKMEHGISQAGLNALVAFKTENTGKPILAIGASGSSVELAILGEWEGNIYFATIGKFNIGKPQDFTKIIHIIWVLSNSGFEEAFLEESSSSESQKDSQSPKKSNSSSSSQSNTPSQKSSPSDQNRDMPQKSSQSSQSSPSEAVTLKNE